MPAIEIVAHRSFWSMVFLFLYLILFAKVGFRIFVRDRQELFLLSVTGILIAINWYGFIYAVNSGKALQASLGYYIFPLVAQEDNAESLLNKLNLTLKGPYSIYTS